MTKPERPPGWTAVRMASILVGVVAVLYFGRELFIPLAFAITLTVILAPAVAKLETWHVRRGLAVAFLMLVMLFATAGIGYVIFNQVVQVLAELPGYRSNIHNKIQSLRIHDKSALGRAQESVKELGKELAAPPVAPAQPAKPTPVQIVDQPSNGLQYLRDVTQPFLIPVAMFGMVIVFAVFLLIEETDIRNRVFRLAGLDRLHAVTQALEDAVHRVSRYLFLQFLVNAVFGLLCTLGLALIGVPYAALWGVIAALLRIVPYVGAVSAGLLPLLLSLAVFDGWKAPLLVFALYAILETATGNFIEPWLYGAHTGISGLALLLTTVFWTALWGPAGLILSTPLTVCVVVLGRHVPHLSFLHILLGDQPVLTADAHLYQRLLALDDREARSVVDQYLTENSFLQLCDTVIIPTLTMAEQDRHRGILEPDREEFIFMSLREMMHERSGSAEPGVRPARPVVCIPANDEADELAASLLIQTLEQAGCPAILLPSDSLTEAHERDILIISSVPPFAFTHARTLNRRIRERFPNATTVVGVWGFSGENQRAMNCFRPAHPEKLVTTFAEALEFLAPEPGRSEVMKPGESPAIAS